MNKLRERREALQMTQKQVAAKIGILWQTYQRYESGNVLPNVLTALDIAEALQTTVEALYKDK